jgi:hypothetical protein
MTVELDAAGALVPKAGLVVRRAGVSVMEVIEPARGHAVLRPGRVAAAPLRGAPGGPHPAERAQHGPHPRPRRPATAVGDARVRGRNPRGGRVARRGARPGARQRRLHDAARPVRLHRGAGALGERPLLAPPPQRPAAGSLEAGRGGSFRLQEGRLGVMDDMLNRCSCPCGPGRVAGLWPAGSAPRFARELKQSLIFPLLLVTLRVCPTPPPPALPSSSPFPPRI